MALIADIDRRTVGALSNPRNVAELHHALRVDPYTKDRSEEQLVKDLIGLEERGLVVNLGEQSDFGKLIANLPKAAVAVHDDTARAYVEILDHANGGWRRGGDHWIMTGEGLSTLVDDSDAPAALTPTQVQNVIDQEWGRTLKDLSAGDLHPEHPAQTASMLLLDEFQRWVEAVSDECERVWNVRPDSPMPPSIGGGAGWSDLYSRLIIDHENQKTALPALVAPWYMALLTTTPTDATAYASLVEAAYTGYARKSVAAADMPAASGAPGAAANTTAITFAACTGSTSTVIAFANVADSSGSSTTAGFRKWGTCSSTVVSTTQTPAQFAIGAYSTSAD